MLGKKIKCKNYDCRHHHYFKKYNCDKMDFLCADKPTDDPSIRKLIDDMIELRKDNNMTQMEVANRSNLSINIIQVMEYGSDSKLKLNYVNKYLSAFGKTLQWQIVKHSTV